MDELLANLNTDAPMFDAPSVLGTSFDMTNGFITEQPDQVSLYPSDMKYTVPQQSPPQQSEDYFEVDDPDVKPPKPPPSPPPPLPSPTITKTEPAAVPESPADSERNLLRPLALSVVSDAWSTARTPAEFYDAVRQRLPTTKPGEENSNMPANGAVLPELPIWGLPEATGGALLDGLFVKIINADAASTRLMSYLTHLVVIGAVSQREILSTCLKWINTNPNISDRVMQALARMLARLIPFYQFSKGDGLTKEVNDFLAAFITVVKSSARTPSIAHELVTVLQHDRVIALVRVCARRVPSIWTTLNTSIAELESSSLVMTDPRNAPISQSAFTVAPELKELVPRLRKGLCVGITSLESIAYSIGNQGVPAPDSSQPIALQTAFAVTVQVFGTDVATALRDLWSQKERQRGDLPLLVALEKATAQPNLSQAHSTTQKYGFKNKVQACEAIVRFLAQRSSEPGASEKWKGLWGGKERLKRIIRDAIPQVKNEIQSETGALIVSMAVTCCAAMCLGPALRICDTNDGIDVLDPAEASKQEAQNEEVEETMGELIAFAVESLEEAALAEETPKWRSFGVWLLLLMSRSGSMLRASGCDHVRAAKVLRAWGGMPTGTPGTHTSQSGSNKHYSQSVASHQHSQGSSSSWATQEGVAMLAASSSCAIIDVSDVSGSDDTIHALCQDLVQ